MMVIKNLGRHSLLRQLRPYAAIPAVVLPSRALQCHPRRCGSLGRQDITIPAVVHPLAFRQLHPRTSV
jgi:hypothetical protein